MQNKKHGFTLIEIIIVITIFVIMVAGSITPISNFLEQSQLNEISEELMQKLQEMRSNAHINLQTSDWGILLVDNGDESQFRIFRGSSYDAFPDSYEIYNLPSRIQFQNINLDRNLLEIVFVKNSGNTLDFGSFDLYNTSRPDNLTTFNINPLGIIDLSRS